MRLKQLLALFLLAVASGVGGWWWLRQPRDQAAQVRSVALDESLNPTQSAELTFVDPQDEALVARVIAPPGKGLTGLAVDQLQPPFLRPACCLSAVDTCLASIYGHEVSGRYMVQLSPPTHKLLDKPDLAFAFGRILGEPDRVRAFFVEEYGTLAAYFAFVRYIRAVSLENHVNPALAYSLYDYLLRTAEDAGRPLSTLPHPQRLTNQINTSLSAYNRGEVPGDAVAHQFANLNGWSAADKALAAGLSWSLSDPDLLTQALAEPGSFDLYYHDRIQGTFDNKPFEASFSGADFPEGNYRQGQQVAGMLAACRMDRAGLCLLAGPDSNDLWQLTCRWAPFLDEFCDGTLPVL